VTFVGLNPSTADAIRDDATIRKCIGFAQRWGFGRLVMVNVFAWRDCDPRGLVGVRDPVGPDNDAALVRAAQGADRVVLAWGATSRLPRGQITEHARSVRELFEARARCDVGHLGLCKGGAPRHPLMLPYSTPFTREGLTGRASRLR
jgi:hypothetical protein